MEKILEEKKLRNKEIFTVDSISKEKNVTEIQFKKITGLRKKQTKDYIMEKRKQYSQNLKSSIILIEEDMKLRIEEDLENFTLVIILFLF